MRVLDYDGGGRRRSDDYTPTGAFVHGDEDEFSRRFQGDFTISKPVCGRVPVSFTTRSTEYLVFSSAVVFTAVKTDTFDSSPTSRGDVQYENGRKQRKKTAYSKIVERSIPTISSKVRREPRLGTFGVRSSFCRPFGFVAFPPPSNRPSF